MSLSSMGFINEAAKLRCDIRHSYSKTIYGDDDGMFDNLIMNYESIIPFEKPDMYFINNKTVIGIEHFQFDSYKAVKGGSEGIKTIKAIEREVSRIASTRDRSIKNIEITKPVETKMSFENYRNNLMNGLENHLKKLAIYKKRLYELFTDNNDIKICLYIVDETPLGNHFVSLKGKDILEPLLITEFQKRLFESREVDYVISCFTDEFNFKRLSFFHNTLDNHTNCLTEVFDTSRHIFVDYTYERISYVCG